MENNQYNPNYYNWTRNALGIGAGVLGTVALASVLRSKSALRKLMQYASKRKQYKTLQELHTATKQRYNIPEANVVTDYSLTPLNLPDNKFHLMSSEEAYKYGKEGIKNFSWFPRNILRINLELQRMAGSSATRAPFTDAPIVFIDKKTAIPEVLAHEAGHLKRLNTFKDYATKYRDGVWQNIKNLWNPKSSQVYKEEAGAWDAYGVSKNNPFRHYALKTYENGLRGRSALVGSALMGSGAVWANKAGNNNNEANQQF